MATKSTAKNSVTKTAHKEAIWPGLGAAVPKPLMPYSAAIRAGDWVFNTGQITSAFQTELAPEVVSANSHLGNELSLQSSFLLRNLANTIKACDFDINQNMVRSWQWLVSENPSESNFEKGDNWPSRSI